jgi:hypothetical protein
VAISRRNSQVTSKRGALVCNLTSPSADSLKDARLTLRARSFLKVSSTPLGWNSTSSSVNAVISSDARLVAAINRIRKACRSSLWG